MKRNILRPRHGEFLLLSDPDACRRLRATTGSLPVYYASQLIKGTVSRNLSYAFELGCTPPEEKGSRLCRAGNILEIRDLLDLPVDQLTPLERHRVELVCGLLYAPPVLFVEEPPLPRHERVVGQFRRLQAEFGVTTLWASPDPEPLMPLADRVAVFESGRLNRRIPHLAHPPEAVQGGWYKLAAAIVG